MKATRTTGLARARRNVRIAEAKLRIAKKVLREAQLTAKPTGFVACEPLWDDDVNAVKLPAGSTYAGDWLVYSISSRGAWFAAAVIVKNFDTARLFDCNPFCDVKELQKDGFEAVAKFTAKGYSSEEAVTFQLAPGETYIDYYGDGKDPISGVYFGDDVENYVLKLEGFTDEDY